MKLQTLILQIPIKLLAPVAQQLIFITGQLGIYAGVVKKSIETKLSYAPSRLMILRTRRRMSKTRTTQTKRAYKKL